MSEYKDIYILNVIPLIIDKTNSLTYYYIDDTNTGLPNKVQSFSLTNITTEFYVKELTPEFEKYIRAIVLKYEDIALSKESMYDSEAFTFNHKYNYFKISSTNCWSLKNIYQSLERWLLQNVKIFTEYKNQYDKLFYNMTETPFRFIVNTTNLYKLPYYVNSKYSIPLVGPIKCKIPKTGITNFNENIFKQGDNALQNTITILSYDIETLNTRGNANDPNDQKQEIINIGIGLFKLNEPKPFKRISVISKPISIDELSTDPRIKSYTIDKNVYHITDETDEVIDYVCVNSEKEILLHFMKYIKTYKPYFITGFNNWGFDDLWIYTKLKLHNLLGIFESILGNKPEFKSLNLKLDGQQIQAEYKTWTGGLIHFQDTMYQAVKEDPKRFSDRSRKNLDTMLEVYNIKSPYIISGKEHVLSKTGLSIFDMWDYFKLGKNIYSIAKYCCQDAWITGVFCIRRNHIGDLIEMSNITYTSIEDSLFKAVNIRVMNTSQHYAYKSHKSTYPFAFYDVNPRLNRNCKIKPLLGGKEYDYRIYTGGAVKNLKNGREKFIVALDFSSMYPSQKEGSNVDTSSRVDEDIILNPRKYGLKMISKRYFEDNYGPRWHYLLKPMGKYTDNLKDPYYNNITNIDYSDIFLVEEFYTEFSISQKDIIDLYENYNTLKEETSKKYINSLFQKEIYPLKFKISDIKLEINGNSKQIVYPKFPKTIMKKIIRLRKLHQRTL